MNKSGWLWLIVALMMLLQACGGGSESITPVSITSQPVSTTVVEGATATFSVVATGGGILRYQWKANGTDIAGATASTYTIAAVPATASGTTYTVQVSNEQNSQLSTSAVLSVMVPPAIANQPSSATVSAGSVNVLSVTATGTAPLSYQWRLNGANIPGATQPSYTTPALSVGDSGARYDVVVTNAAGSATSQQATLTVEIETRTAALESAPLARLQVDLAAQFAAAGFAASNSFTAQQTAGPALDLSLSGGFLNVIGPVDTGVDRSAIVLVQGSSGRIQMQITFPTTRLVVANDAGDRDTDGGTRIALSGKVAQQGTVGTANDVVSSFTGIGFTITAAALPAAIEIHMATRTAGRNVTALFDYNAATGVARIKADKVSELTTLVGVGSGVTFTVTGKDLNSQVSLIYAPSKIRGRLVNASGVVQTTLQGRKVTLEGGITAFSDQATVAADGSFVFAAVPVESFNLELRDPSNALIAQASPVVTAAGQDLSIDLVVVATASGQSAAPGARILSAGTNAQLAAPSTPYLGAIEKSRTAGGEPVVVARRDAQRVGALAATPTSCEPQPGSFVILGSAENAVLTCTGTHTIAKGSTQIKVTVTVDTDEFPGYSPTPGNPYNDRWSYNVQLGAGKLFAAAGRVNDTHATRGSIKLVDECVNVATQTTNADLTASVNIQSTNIGDSVLPTTVRVSFGPCAGLQVSEFRLDRASPDVAGNLFYNNKAGADEVKYHLALPRTESGYTTLQFPATIKYLPATATITEVKLQIEHAGGTIDLIANALAQPNAYTTAAGTITFSKLRIPASTAGMFSGLATLRVTIKGTEDGNTLTSDSTGAYVAGDSKRPTNFLPLFDASQRLTLATSRRYSGRDEVVGASVNCPTCGGLDGWGLKETLDKLNAVDWVFNDITAQHTARTASGRSILDHGGHANGRQVDVRYWDDTGAQGNGPLNGAPTADGSNPILLLIGDVCQTSRKKTDGTLKTAVADNPQYSVLVNWITQNRSKIAAVMARTDVAKVHIPEVGSQIYDALKKGHCPAAAAARIVPAEWAPNPNKLSPAPPHNDHWHVNFN